MKLGISTYTFTWAVGVPGHLPPVPLSIHNLIDLAHNYHLDCLQIADNLPLHQFDEVSLLSYKKYADEKGIAIEVGTRGLKTDHISNYIKIAKLFDSPFLRIVIDEINYHPSLEEIVKTLKDIVLLLQEHQMTLAIENHDRFLASQFIEIIQAVDSDRITICLDSVNSMGAGEGFREVCEALLPYTINLHIKDFSIRRVSHMMGFEIIGQPAGTGMLDIEYLLKQASKSSDCISAILELWTPPEPSLNDTIIKEKKWADDSIEYLKTLKNKYFND